MGKWSKRFWGATLIGASLWWLSSCMYKNHQAEETLVRSWGTKPVVYVVNQPNPEDNAKVIEETKEYCKSRPKALEIPKFQEGPGLKFKLPWPIQTISQYSTKGQLWYGYPDKIQTKDDQFVYSEVTAVFSIQNSYIYAQTTQTLSSAHNRLNNIVDGITGGVIRSGKLIDVVRSTNRPIVNLAGAVMSTGDSVDMGRRGKENEIQTQSETALDSSYTGLGFKGDGYGVQLMRVLYTKESKEQVEKSMMAERRSVAERIRAWGTRESLTTMGAAKRAEDSLISYGEMTAKEIKGRAQAHVTRRYGETYSQDPEFYKLVRSLDILGDRNNFGPETKLVLPWDDPTLRHVQGN